MGRITIIIAVVALGLGISVWIYVLQHKPKTAYVQLGKLYENFNMKKELEKKYEKISMSRKNILDSLEINLRSLSGQIELLKENDPARKSKIQDFELLRQDYLMKKKNFSEDTERTSQQYDEEIWKQLNQYVNDYGKENEYTYIYGAQGNGSLMYGSEKEDITGQVNEYVNHKYKGIK